MNILVHMERHVIALHFFSSIKSHLKNSSMGQLVGQWKSSRVLDMVLILYTEYKGI